jgi:hypothetical protein
VKAFVGRKKDQQLGDMANTAYTKHQTRRMVGSPYSGNFFRGVYALFILSPFPSLGKRIVHYDLSKYDCWLIGRIGMDEKGISCIFSSPMDNK